MALSYQAVADQFVPFYYNTFDGDRSQLVPLYRDTSMLTFESSSVQGAAAIVEKLSISTKDAQPTADGGVIVLVTGQLLVDEEQRPMNFSQVFQLRQDGGTYYVHNDIFKLIFG